MAGFNPLVTSSFDIQGVSKLSGLASSGGMQQEAAVETIAKEFESLFFNLIAKSMSDATDTLKSGLFDTRNMDLFQELLFTEISRDMSSRNGLGVAEWLKSIQGLDAKVTELDKSV